MKTPMALDKISCQTFQQASRQQALLEINAKQLPLAPAGMHLKRDAMAHAKY